MQKEDRGGWPHADCGVGVMGWGWIGRGTGEDLIFVKYQIISDVL